MPAATARSADDLIHKATEAYRNATGPGRGYLGVHAAESVWAAATADERREIARRLKTLGWAEYRARNSGKTTPESDFVSFAGSCCYGSEIECRPGGFARETPVGMPEFLWCAILAERHGGTGGYTSFVKAAIRDRDFPYPAARGYLNAVTPRDYDKGGWTMSGGFDRAVKEACHGVAVTFPGKS